MGQIDLQTRKLSLIQEFLKIQKVDIIDKIESIIESSLVNSGETNRTKEEQIIDRIKQSENDFANNRFKTSEELLEKYQR